VSLCRRGLVAGRRRGSESASEIFADRWRELSPTEIWFRAPAGRPCVRRRPENQCSRATVNLPGIEQTVTVFRRCRAISVPDYISLSLLAPVSDVHRLCFRASQRCADIITTTTGRQNYVVFLLLPLANAAC